MSNEKPEALELADIFENLAHPTGTRYRAAIAKATGAASSAAQAAKENKQ